MSYYLSGTRHGLSAAEARDIAFQKYPAVARPQDRADWTVFFLTSGPVQPGQVPFELQQGELSTPLRNTRIAVIDLIIAARALHEFRVVAAGHTFATLELTEEQRAALTRAHVAWQYD